MRDRMKCIQRLLMLACIAALCGHAAAGETDPLARERERMVSRTIESRGVRDPAVLKAIRSVPRHLLVPEKERRDSYGDHPLPIGHGQTISQPYIVALMTELIRPEPGIKVLEIGTGSGYQAAVLAETGAKVFTIEIVPELARQSRDALREIGVTNVEVREGDGYFGWPEESPFDAIIVTAAAERIPPPLLAQLKDGGRMIIPVGPALGDQFLVLVTKNGESVRTRRMIPVRFVPFTRQ